MLRQTREETEVREERQGENEREVEERHLSAEHKGLVFAF